MPQQPHDKAISAARLKPAPEMTEPRLEEVKAALDRIDRDLKQQTTDLRDSKTPEKQDGRPADAKLKAEGKGVI